MIDNQFFYGVVEDRSTDPLKLGRCKVRVVGVHTEDKSALPTADLPWALPLSGINSAGISGVGIAPFGLVEGSWVIVTYLDQYRQAPIIVGSFAGISLDPGMVVNNLDSTVVLSDTSTSESETGGVVTTQTPLTDTSGTPVVDGSGNPIITETTTPVTTTTGTKTISEAGKRALKSLESLASLEAGKIKFGSDSTPPSTLIYAYGDAGNYAIGWGNQFLENGSRVTATTVLTKSQCDALFEQKLAAEFVPGVNNMLAGKPVTQGMFDALVSMGYNMGLGRLGNTDAVSDIKAGNFESAAAKIPTTVITSQGVVSESLRRRRRTEAELFKRDGLGL